MASDEQLSYASVVFKTKTQTRPRGVAEKEEEIVYEEVQARNQTEKTSEPTAGFTADKKESSVLYGVQCVTYCLGSLCVVLLLVIVGVSAYVHTLKWEKEDLEIKQEYLLAVNQNLRVLNRSLSSDNDNLTRANQNMAANIQNLTAQNQELDTQKKNLSEKLQNIEASERELNISRAQWTVNQYCQEKYYQRKQCLPCQRGWISSLSSCYAIVDYSNSSFWRTWEEAREDCREKISDLVVMKNKVSVFSQESWGTEGYWIGLRVQDGAWKWIDGTSYAYWNRLGNPIEGHCVISQNNYRLKSVRCDLKNRWICEKKSLSI